jgi:AraC-like DNA-binding protein
MFCRLDAEFRPVDFPEKFSNQIYFSGEIDLDYYKYESVYSIKYVVNGAETYNVNGKEHTIFPGEFLLVNNKSCIENIPNTSHGISIFLDPSLINEVLLNSDRNSKNILDNIEVPNLNPEIHEKIYKGEDSLLYKRIQKMAEAFPEFIKNPNLLSGFEIFYHFAFDLIQQQNDKIIALSNINAEQIQTRQEALNRLELAKCFIHDNAGKAISLEELSKVAMLSPFYLHRRFKEVFHCSPHQYIQDLRLKKGVELLKSGEMSLYEIADSLDYSDASSFIKAFKKKFQESPVNWISKNGQ